MIKEIKRNRVIVTFLNLLVKESTIKSNIVYCYKGNSILSLYHGEIGDWVCFIYLNRINDVLENLGLILNNDEVIEIMNYEFGLRSYDKRIINNR